MLGWEEEHRYWQSRVDSYRDTNPYYHAWLGDQAGEEGDWRGAKEHYEDALSLAPSDAGLQFALGIIYRELGQPKAALRYVEMAMNNATLYKEQKVYQLEYDRINRSLLVVQ
jgi:tetratricopeptide (TPR) repeat protein